MIDDDEDKKRGVTECYPPLKTPDSMKFPRGLMCLSFRAAIPLRAVATVQIQ